MRLKVPPWGDRIPRPEDEERSALSSEGVPEVLLEAAGFALPDRLLWEGARELRLEVGTPGIERR